MNNILHQLDLPHYEKKGSLPGSQLSLNSVNNGLQVIPLGLDIENRDTKVCERQVASRKAQDGG